jgi:hypothetical protein
MEDWGWTYVGPSLYDLQHLCMLEMLSRYGFENSTSSKSQASSNSTMEMNDWGELWMIGGGLLGWTVSI